MPPKKVSIFLDTSVVLSGLFSATGGARELFRLGKRNILILYAGKSVLKEADGVLLRKKPELRILLATYLSNARVKTPEQPTEKAKTLARRLMDYAPDAQILAEAIQTAPDWFVTHDRQHFLDNADLSELPFQIGTPGDALLWLREQ